MSGSSLNSWIVFLFLLCGSLPVIECWTNLPIHRINLNGHVLGFKGILSSKMDQAESDLIQKVFIKGRGIEIFSEFSLFPVLCPFRAPPCFLLPISKPIGIAPMKFFAPLSKAGKGNIYIF
jgi:hypothetical protein